MRSVLLKIFALLLSAMLFWQIVCWITGAGEPWDAASYWHLWYPVSLALSALSAQFLKDYGWMTGPTITFAQAPIMWINKGIEPLIALEMLMLCVLAIPAVVLSALTCWLVTLARPV